MGCKSKLACFRCEHIGGRFDSEIERRRRGFRGRLHCQISTTCWAESGCRNLAQRANQNYLSSAQQSVMPGAIRLNDERKTMNDAKEYSDWQTYPPWVVF